MILKNEQDSFKKIVASLKRVGRILSIESYIFSNDFENNVQKKLKPFESYKNSYLIFILIKLKLIISFLCFIIN